MMRINIWVIVLSLLALLVVARLLQDQGMHPQQICVDDPTGAPVFKCRLPADPTPSSQLATLSRLPDTRFSWLGIEGVKAQVVPGVPAIDGQSILRLIAVQDGLHTVAAQAAGLVKNERHRISAWVRPQAGANFGIGARDQIDKPDGPNKGRITFDLSNRKILTSDGNARAGIEQIGEWLRVWIDLPTIDGRYVVNFYIYRGAQFSYPGDGKLGVLLGGVAVD